MQMSDQVWRSKKGIPIRNLWLLLVYASGLAEFEVWGLLAPTGAAKEALVGYVENAGDRRRRR